MEAVLTEIVDAREAAAKKRSPAKKKRLPILRNSYIHEDAKPQSMMDWDACERQSPVATTPAMEKTGRYMAITIPPQTPPRNTIMIGSISWVSPSTAVSTSSS